MRLRLAVLAILALGGMAQAAEVVDSQFQVEITRDGETTTSTAPIVPFLPDETCYYWYLQMATGTGEVSMVERLVLPAPATAWDPEDGDTTTKIVVDADGKGVTSSFTAEPDKAGWINGGWCIAEGDPLGSHEISVQADGKPAASWRFTVVPPEDYAFPAKPAGRGPDSPTSRG